MKKRVLIVDHDGNWGQKKLFPKDNEVVVADSFALAFEKLEVRYGKSWEELEKQFPVPATPCQSPHVKRADRMHEARWKSKLPYWDAVLTDLCAKEDIDGSQIGFGIGFLAAIAKVPYVAIIGRHLPLVSGGWQTSQIFRWLPPLPVWSQWFIPIGNRVIYFGSSRAFETDNREQWVKSLITTILANSPDEPKAPGLPIAFGVVPMTKTKRSQEDIIEEAWPGLLAKK